jgi:hypothetical protein
MTDPKPTSSLHDVFPTAPTTVDTPFEVDTTTKMENAPVETTSDAYTSGAPIIGARDDQQLPDTDKGFSG